MERERSLGEVQVEAKETVDEVNISRKSSILNLPVHFSVITGPSFMIDSKSVAKVKVEKKSYSVCWVKDGKVFEIFALAVPSLKLEKISERRSQKCYVCG
jgi:hypothetical protein